jgi:preprotein translocase subunit SecG
MIVIASILLILAVLVQSPKSGMAANFGAANQTMGVRQTSDFLEKFTWAMIAAIVIFTLLSVVFAGKGNEEVKNNELTSSDVEAAMEQAGIVNEAEQIDEEFTPEADANATEEVATEATAETEE